MNWKMDSRDRGLKGRVLLGMMGWECNGCREWWGGVSRGYLCYYLVWNGRFLKNGLVNGWVGYLVLLWGVM